MPNKERYLSEVQCQYIIELDNEGQRQVAIAKSVKCSRTGVQLTLKRFFETRFLQDKPKSSRKRKTTERQNRLLKRLSLANRRKISSELAREFHSITNFQIPPQTGS